MISLFSMMSCCWLMGVYYKIEPTGITFTYQKETVKVDVILDHVEDPDMFNMMLTNAFNKVTNGKFATRAFPQ